MPLRADRPCAQCGVTTQGKYCPAHENDNRDIRRRREFDRERADDPFRRFYKLTLWIKQIAPAIRRRDPLCKICGVAASTVVDHIVPARVYCAQGGSFWDKKNLQGLCKPCHDRKTATEDSQFAKEK